METQAIAVGAGVMLRDLGSTTQTTTMMRIWPCGLVLYATIFAANTSPDPSNPMHKPPLHSADPTDWFMYSDWLKDHDGSERDQLKALEVAVGLERTPKLVFVSAPAMSFNAIAFRPGHTTYKDYAGLRWWTVWHAMRQCLWSEITIERLLSCPADFPGLVEERPALALAFYAKVRRGLQALPDGCVYGTSRKMQGVQRLR